MTDFTHPTLLKKLLRKSHRVHLTSFTWKILQAGISVRRLTQRLRGQMQATRQTLPALKASCIERKLRKAVRHAKLWFTRPRTSRREIQKDLTSEASRQNLLSSQDPIAVALASPWQVDWSMAEMLQHLHGHCFPASPRPRLCQENIVAAKVPPEVSHVASKPRTEELVEVGANRQSLWSP